MKTLSLFLFALALSLAGYPQNWISLNSGTTNHLNSICFPDTSTGYVVGSNGTILKTTDGGLNWAPQYFDDSYNFFAVQFINSDTGYIAGGLPGKSTGILLKTTDGGTNWIWQEIDTTTYFGALQLLGSDTIFAIGPRILRTFDGGISWSVVNTPEGGAFWACNAEIYFMVGAYVEIYNTTDGGENWESQFYAAAPGGIWDIGFSNFSNGLAVGGGYSQGIYYELLYWTRTGGDSWDRSTYESDKTYAAVFFTDDTTAYVVGTEGSIIKTIDAGEHFTEESSGTSETLSDVYFTGSGIGYIAGSNGTILKTSSAPLGIDVTITPDDFVTVCPNPFQDQLSIEIDRRFKSENASSTIYNAQGQLLLEKEITFPKTVLDVSSLVPGIYFLKVTNPGHQQVIKLIKDRNP